MCKHRWRYKLYIRIFFSYLLPLPRANPVWSQTFLSNNKMLSLLYVHRFIWCGWYRKCELLKTSIINLKFKYLYRGFNWKDWVWIDNCRIKSEDINNIQKQTTFWDCYCHCLLCWIECLSKAVRITRIDIFTDDCSRVWQCPNIITHYLHSAYKASSMREACIQDVVVCIYFK